MNRSVIILLAFLLPLTNFGCGTVRNVQTGGEPYGGVRMKCYDWCGGGGQNAGFAAAVLWPFWLIDKPLCLVGDTVTLPYCLWSSLPDISPSPVNNPETKPLQQ